MEAQTTLSKGKVVRPSHKKDEGVPIYLSSEWHLNRDGTTRALELEIIQAVDVASWFVLNVDQCCWAQSMLALGCRALPREDGRRQPKFHCDSEF